MTLGGAAKSRAWTQDRKKKKKKNRKRRFQIYINLLLLLLLRRQPQLASARERKEFTKHLTKKTE